MKRSFFQAAVVSILLYGCTTWTLTKRLEKKLDGNYTRMLRAILNKSWRQHPTRHQLYGHLPPITKTIQVRRARHAGHCWRSKDELVSDVLLWTPTYGQAKAGRHARTYIQQLCQDTGCNPEDLPEAMDDREKWREMVKDIRAGGMTSWWWWWHSLQHSRDLQQFLFFVNHGYANISLLCFSLVMLSASHWLLAQARFCGRTHLPLSPNSTTPPVQVIFRYLRPDAPVFNITVGMLTFRQSPCWYYPWSDIILSTSSDTQHLWTWWHFGDHNSLINLSVDNIRRIHTRRSR